MELKDWFEGFLAGWMAALGALLLVSSFMRENLLKTSLKHQSWTGAGFVIYAVGQFLRSMGMDGWSLAVTAIATALILWSVWDHLRRRPGGSATTRDMP